MFFVDLIGNFLLNKSLYKIFFCGSGGFPRMKIADDKFGEIYLDITRILASLDLRSQI